MSPSRDDPVANAPASSEDDPAGGGSANEERSPGDEDRSPSAPRHSRTSADERPTSAGEWLHWARTVDRGPVMWIRELAISAGAVILIGLLLFALSGVWPPMVAVESGSMEPHMHKGDLVFVADSDRFTSDAAHGNTGVAPAEQASEVSYLKFGEYGDVIVFKPNGDGDRTPIIHRAHMWVSEGEDWYDRADPAYVGGAESCDELRNCPAPHDGFITRGDNNPGYDQVLGQSDPVREEWVIATARVRVPWLGWIRLYVSELALGTSVWIELESEFPALEFSELTSHDGERVVDPAIVAGWYHAS